MDVKTCWDCKASLPVTNFYRNPNTRDGFLRQCKACGRKRWATGIAERAKRDRLYFQTIKVERGCADCGYKVHPVALDFDHLPGTTKRYALHNMAGMRRSAIDAEIAKCEVVCANCHRIRTHERLKENDGDQEGPALAG